MNSISIAHSSMEKTGSKVFPLTAREREIQSLLTTGMTNKMIARKLDIGTGTGHIQFRMCVM